MKAIKTVFFIFLIITFSTTDLWARRGPMGMFSDKDGDRPGRMGMMRGRMGMMRGKGRCYGDPNHMRKNLKLSENQISKIGNINSRYKTKLIAYRDLLFPEKEKLRRMLLNKKINFVKLKELLKKISDIEIEIRLIKIRQRVEIEKSLSVEQRASMKNLSMLNQF